jgi:sulfonate transport system substrate-binding protein
MIRPVGTLLCVVFCSLLPGEPASRATAPPEPELTIAVNTTTIESFPIFLAAESFSAGNHNYRVKLVPLSNGRAAMAQLVSGTADAATGSETQALLNSVADPHIRIVLTVSECRYRIIARRSAGISRVRDLRGKKVAATPNTSSLYYLAGMLRAAKVAESDIEIVPLEGQEMAAALKAGIVDAVSIWEPHAQNSLEAIGKDAVVFEDPSVYTERFNLNTTTDVLSDPVRRIAMRQFVEAIQAASARLRMQPQPLITALAPRVGLTDQKILAVWRQFEFPASLSTRLTASLNEVEPWVASTQKRAVRSRQQLASLIDSSILMEAQQKSAAGKQ